MKPQAGYMAPRWTLAALVDLEVLLTRSQPVDDAGRRYFAREIRPRLADLDNESARRRAGLRHWLAWCRDSDAIPAGRVFGHALNLAGWAAFILLALSGMGLVAGVLTGADQAVHVVVFFGLTLVLPWLIHVAGLLLRAVSHRGGAGTLWLTRAAVSGFSRGRSPHEPLSTMVDRLTESRATRRVLSATLSALMQRGAIGFLVGLIAAFVGCLLLFDVRFYWEATPQAGMQALLVSLTRAIAAPWAWAWPQALPDAADIAATRAAAGAPVSGDGSWWRFLLMALLVWGLLPRLLLLTWYRLAARRALARLTFQAPRHRELWRQLNSIERGEVAPGAADGVLVLDVGGHGLTGDAVRGFLLRHLRVNPLTTLPISVLDADREARTEQALAAGPAGVVLLVEGWALSPRQVENLHARLRHLLGAAVPMTWLVFALDRGQPAAPEAGDMRRWTQQIDSLRDPATEVAAYGV